MKHQSQLLPTEELKEHYAWVKRVAHSLVRDVNVAGDLAQEAWVVALESPPAKGIDLRAWLSGVVRNRARHLWRRERTRQDHEQQVLPSKGDAPAPEELLASSEATRALVEELQALEEPFRTTLLLSAMSELSAVEIATREAVPQGTVRWRMKRGRELLAERLDKRYGNRKDWLRGVTGLLAPRKGALVSAGGAAGIGSPVLVLATVVAALFSGIFLWPTTETTTDGPTGIRSAQGIASNVRAERPAKNDRQPTQPASTGETETRKSITTPSRAKAVANQPLDASQAEVRVRLVSSSGTPLAKTRFELPGDRGSFTSTGAQGYAVLRFRPLASSSQLIFYAGSAGRGPGSLTRVAVPVHVRAGHSTNVGTIVLYPLVTLRGKVVDRDGSPVANVSIFLSEPERSLPARQLRECGPPLWTTFAHYTVETDLNGNFELKVPELPLLVWCGSLDALYSSSPPPTPGETLEMVIDKLPTSAAIRGRVVNPAGHALAGALVRGTSPSAAQFALANGQLPRSLQWRSAAQRVKANANGEFVLPTRGPQTVLVRVRDPQDHWADVELPLVPGSSDVLVTLDRELE